VKANCIYGDRYSFKNNCHFFENDWQKIKNKIYKKSNVIDNGILDPLLYYLLSDRLIIIVRLFQKFEVQNIFFRERLVRVELIPMFNETRVPI
jgi:hypothetical protein